MISLSSLLKQWYITEDTQMRVINSNERVRERLKELEAEQKTVSPDGGEPSFEEGIAVQEIDLEAIREDVLAKANEEAEELLAAAKEKAERRREEAEQEAQALFEEQKRLGFEEGAKDKEAELEAEKTAMEAEYRSRHETLEQHYGEKFSEMESDIVDAVITVFNKVFEIQFDDKREILLALVNRTLTEETPGERIRIQVNEKNRAMLEEHLDELQERVGQSVAIEFMHDTKLSDEQCRIETEYGVFDCGIDTQLNGLIKDIRSLVSVEPKELLQAEPAAQEAETGC